MPRHNVEERRRGCAPSTADFVQNFNQRRDPPVERQTTIPPAAMSPAALPEPARVPQ